MRDRGRLQVLHRRAVLRFRTRHVAFFLQDDPEVVVRAAVERIELERAQQRLLRRVVFLVQQAGERAS